MVGLDISGLVGAHDVIEGTILLFFFHGLAAAGFTYCITFLFKSPASAQNVMIFINVRVCARVCTDVGCLLGCRYIVLGHVTRRQVDMHAP